MQDTDFTYDKQLVRRAGDGDEEASRELVERHQDRVYRLSYRLTGDVEAARDITQDTFLRLLQNLRRIEDGQALTRWLTRTATNLTRDRWRTRRDTVEFDDSFEEGSRSSSSHLVEDAQLGERIQRALMELPHRYREAFVLRHVEDLSHEQMCDQLGIGLSAVKVRIHRACHMLRELLPEYEEE
ncbi:MAG: RNA polymerase sigma factor [Candidatus Latescibacteria bacterium]|nr:RNA polymerase sigma factor [Candidatus Latescibacterota bacterium]